MIVTLAILAALALDTLLGEPRRFHPLAGFGRLALALERRWHGDAVWRGLVAVLALLVPFTLLAALTRFVPHGLLLDILLLYLAIGWRSLGEHAQHVRAALLAKNLPEVRSHGFFHFRIHRSGSRIVKIYFLIHFHHRIIYQRHLHYNLPLIGVGIGPEIKCPGPDRYALV